MKLKRTIFAVRGDTHGGHAGGLVNPETEIPVIELNKKGDRVQTGLDHPHLNPTQERLWKWHTTDKADVRHLAGKDEIIFLDMGDLTQGNIFKDDLSEALLSTQYFISKWNTSPWLDLSNVRRTFITKGTGVHVFGEGSVETMLTHHLNSDYPKKRVRIADHFLLDVESFRLDIAHHGSSPGMRNWTRGNVLELYSRSILRDDIDNGTPPPNVILRGHTHEFTWRPVGWQVGNKTWKMDTFITPPYCFIGSHAQKVVKSPSRMSVGLLALEVVNGKLLDFHPFLHTVDLRVKEII